MFGTGKTTRTTGGYTGGGSAASSGSSTLRKTGSGSRFRTGTNVRSTTKTTSGGTTSSATGTSNSRAARGAGTSSRASPPPKTDDKGATATSNGRKRPKDKISFDLRDLELSTTVGTGTFGRVRIAYHKTLKKYYALKIMKKSEVIRLRQVEHIKSEIKLLNMISHPFIVNMIGYHQDAKRLYMLLEYVPGGELFSHLRKEGRFSNDGAKFYAAEIVLAFAYLHEQQIVYRDLKPENLLLTKKGHLKITDFGFAKLVEDKTWTLCGTPEYLAPEIIQSKGHSTGVDWWALGILIYEMLAGYPPFYHENPFGIYQKILAGKIEFPRFFDSKAKDLIRKLLTADRTKRIGCLHGAAEDIKNHKWFSRLNWDAVYSRSIPAPFLPDVRSEHDTRNFDDYPDSDEDTAKHLSTKDQNLFAELGEF